MKKLVMIFAAAGFVLASCGSNECLSCVDSNGNAVDLSFADVDGTLIEGTQICEEDFSADVDMEALENQINSSGNLTCTVE